MCARLMSMPTFLKRSVDGGAVDRPHQAPARLLGHSMSHSSRTLLLPILYTNYIHTTMLHIRDAELSLTRTLLISHDYFQFEKTRISHHIIPQSLLVTNP